MALTWTQAAHQGKWWMSLVHGDIPAYQRHVQQIADAHAVPRRQARDAYINLSDAIRRRTHQAKDFGFSSQPRDTYEGMETPIPDDHDMHDYSGPPRWAHLRSEKVDLRNGLHATQQEMDPHAVAHNLFHPGKLMPTEKHNIGNPDYDPDAEDASVRAHADGVEEHSEHNRFHLAANGRLNVADGHHRLAADLLLGKTHVRGLVWDDRHPPAKTCDDPAHGPCAEQKAFRQEIDAKWPPDPASHLSV